jgi:hypothetical protein
MRRYAATAGAALVGASLLTAAPAPAAALPTPTALRVASADVRLAAAANMLNVPVNLLIDLINAPYNELQAVDFAAKSLFFSGPWMVVSATNIWGVDPGDPSHFQATVNLALPFPALSGLGLDQNDPNGLGQQLWHTIAALLPVDKSCDAEGCTPQVPTSPITGVAGIDSLIWIGALLTGTLQLPLTSQWFTAQAFNELLTTGWTYDAQHPGYVDPSGPAYPIYFNPDGTPLFPGTELGPNGENLLPWHDTTFTLNPFTPVQNYLNHLMADPSTNPIQLPTFEQLGRAIQSFAAAVVMAFDPFTPGSPFCPGSCSWVTDLHLDYPDLVKGIGALWPGNTTIDTWVAAYDNGTANVPTQAQIDRSIQILQQRDFWDFQNPSPPASYSPVFNLSSLAANFHKMWTDFGFNPPPLNPDVDGGDNGTLDSPASPLTALRAAAIEKTPETTAAATTTGTEKTGSGTEKTGSGTEKTGSGTEKTTTGTNTTGSGTETTGSGTETTGSGTETTGSGTNTTTTGTEKTGSGTEKTGSGTEKTGSGNKTTGSGNKTTGSGTEKTGSGNKTTGSDTNKTGSASGTSTGAHSGGGSAA